MKKIIVIITISLLIFINIRMCAAPTWLQRLFGKTPTSQEKSALDCSNVMPGIGLSGQGSAQLSHIIKAELYIVNGLLQACNSHELARMVQRRDMLLRTSIPQVQRVYEKLMNAVTCNKQVDERYAAAKSPKATHKLLVSAKRIVVLRKVSERLRAEYQRIANHIS